MPLPFAPARELGVRTQEVAERHAADAVVLCHLFGAECFVWLGHLQQIGAGAVAKRRSASPLLRAPDGPTLALRPERWGCFVLRGPSRRTPMHERSGPLLPRLDHRKRGGRPCPCRSPRAPDTPACTRR